MKTKSQTLMAIGATVLSANLWADAHTPAPQTHLKNAVMAASGQGNTRPATCRDCFNAGYRKAMATRIALAPSSSSVTTPPSYRTNANIAVTAPVAAVRPASVIRTVASGSSSVTTPRSVTTVSSVTAPAGVGAVAMRIPQNFARPKQRITVRPQAQPQQAVRVTGNTHQAMPQGKIKHGNHYHHTAVQRADCELTETLNRVAGQRITAAHNAHGGAVRHGNHSHASAVERADCALTDALNRSAGVVKTVLKTSNSHHAPQMSPAPIRHGNHYHTTAVQRADCELTDTLNRMAGPVIKRVH